MAEHVASLPLLIATLVSQSIELELNSSVALVLADHPESLTTDEWRQVRRELAGGVATIRFDHERAAYADLIQRLYGRRGWATVDWLSNVVYLIETPHRPSPAAEVALLPLLALIVPRHDAMLGKCHTAVDLAEQDASAPLWWHLRSGSRAQTYLKGERAFGVNMLRYLPALLMASDHRLVIVNTQRINAQIQALDAAIAVELFRRERGRYPEGWGEMVPGYLPAEPVDHSTGLPLLMRVVDGRPVLYGRGLDDDDDGGRMSDAAVKRWPRPVEDAAEDTDWVLWPPVVRAAAERPEAASP